MKTLCWGICLCCFSSFAQTTPINAAWTAKEVASAHTALDTKYLDAVEKEVILYLNLARLYPKKFAETEVKDYTGTSKYVDYVKNSSYKASLIKQLKTMVPLKALVPDSTMSANADCFAVESGTAGKTGHQHVQCPKMNWAECCSYGMDTGRDVALQLLIDDKVPSLGHRMITLDPAYFEIGVGLAPHIKWDVCCVLEII